MRQLLPAGMFATYSLRRPRTAAFWRDATCDEVECVRRRNGWRTVLDVGTQDGQAWAKWISDKSGRHCSVERAGNVVTFVFPAGQNCFEKHKIAIEREPLYLVRPGDLTRVAGQARQHTRGVDWVDDMQTTLDGVREAKQRG